MFLLATQEISLPVQKDTSLNLPIVLEEIKTKLYTNSVLSRAYGMLQHPEVDNELVFNVLFERMRLQQDSILLTYYADPFFIYGNEQWKHQVTEWIKQQIQQTSSLSNLASYTSFLKLRSPESTPWLLGEIIRRVDTVKHEEEMDVLIRCLRMLGNPDYEERALQKLLYRMQFNTIRIEAFWCATYLMRHKPEWKERVIEVLLARMKSNEHGQGLLQCAEFIRNHGQHRMLRAGEIVLKHLQTEPYLSTRKAYFDFLDPLQKVRACKLFLIKDLCHAHKSEEIFWYVEQIEKYIPECINEMEQILFTRIREESSTHFVLACTQELLRLHSAKNQQIEHLIKDKPPIVFQEFQKVLSIDEKKALLFRLHERACAKKEEGVPYLFTNEMLVFYKILQSLPLPMRSHIVLRFPDEVRWMADLLEETA